MSTPTMSTPLADAIDRALEMATSDRVSVMANSNLIAELPAEQVVISSLSVRYRGVLVRASPAQIRAPGYVVQVRVV